MKLLPFNDYNLKAPRIPYVEKRCNIKRQTASTHLNSLVNTDLLEFEKVGRESIYKNTRLIDLLKKF